MRFSINILIPGFMVLIFSCTREEFNPELRLVKNALLHITEIVNGVAREFDYTFDYLYANDQLVEIKMANKKHIEFSYAGDRLIAKRYFNEARTFSDVDSFYYNGRNEIERIKKFNDSTSDSWEIEIIRHNNRLVRYINFYETTYEYLGNNITMVHLDGSSIYHFEYSEENNYQQLSFFLKNPELISQFELHKWSIAIAFSQNLIQTVRGEFIGTQTFRIDYEHDIVNGRYDGYTADWYDQNDDLYRSSTVQFIY